MYRWKVYVVTEFGMMQEAVTESKCISCTKEHYDYCIREVHPHEDQLDKHTILFWFGVFFQ